MARSACGLQMVQWVMASTLLVAAMGVANAAHGNTDLERAVKLNDITGKAAIEAEIRLLVKDATGTKRLLAEATRAVAQKNQPFEYNAAYILAHAAFDLKEDSASEAFYLVCLDHAFQVRSAQEVDDAWRGLTKVYERQSRAGKYALCAELSKSQLEILERHHIGGELKNDVLRRLARARAELGDTAGAERLTQALVRDKEEDWQNMELQAWLLRKMGKTEEAAKTYEKMLEVVEKDGSLTKAERGEILNDIRYILSNVYMDLNQVDKATEQLQILVKEHPDEAAYNNDLGYIWADHDMNLDQAEVLIRKAIELDRKRQKSEGESKPNAAYLDSLGWVLFKEKRYPEAKNALLEAVQDKEGQHVEIFDHLGEVLMALGQRPEAVEAWKKGVAVAGPSKREQERKGEVEKKIKKYQ